VIPFPVLAPFFALILLGWLLGRGPLALPAAQAGLRAFVLYAALPAFVFRFVAEAERPPPAALLAPLAYVLGSAVTGAASALLARTGVRRMAFMAAISANLGYIGLPAIAVSPLGADPAAVGAAIALLVLDVLGTLNLGMVLMTRGGLRAGLRALLRAPIAWAMLAGLAMRGAGLSLPDPAARLAAMLSGGAVPGALISLGAALAGGGAGLSFRPLAGVAWAVPAKLLLHPAAYVGAALLLGLPRGAVVAGAMMAACPVSLGFFLVAAAGGQDTRTAAALCLWSTVAAAPSFALWNALLG
jgi:predicted permease